jgi:hypothetical protein
MRYLPTMIMFGLLLQASAQVTREIGVESELDRVQLPYNRFVHSAGKQVFFGDASLENHALDVALSPDRKWLAVEERTSIVFISTQADTVKFMLRNSFHPDLRGGMNTYSGITWHDNNGIPEVYWSVIGRNNRSFVASAKWDGTKAEFGRLFEYRNDAYADMALPNEILIVLNPIMNTFM